ncbi:hypothetical protein JMF89_02985 [Clostridiaceae bacterium UIB06]|uniref:Uncharacterized protein n=1 Tax=Clostridium thailandense TaxID=2794346 RepID=A0A949TYR0_9CLOT|nr:hypothetical protein [Clostridium thailandense]MBV7274276.1 hypothetical protein [Clostridium thailandense]MCH5136176.1 hypothetical protein [Clostridiaceae bacterium UIB06]
MDIAGIKSTNISIYDTKDDTKKINSKTDTEKAQEKTQTLGTDTFVKSTENDAEPSTYKPVKKKLSTEEVAELKEDQANAKADLIKRFIADTLNNQNKLLGRSKENEVPGMSKETTDLLTKAFGSIEKAYPPLATTPEGAQQAISEGGAYSVNAVADRIMTLAKYIAGDDPNKLQQMRDAVEKGFSEAGLVFKNATSSGLPQICEDTHTEIMRRFDELQGKTSTNNEQTESTK